MTWDSEIEVPPNLENILQMASLYDAYIVVTEGDPLNRNRVRVCCPELWGEGEENWSNWLDVAGTPVGSGKLKGDAGIHWPCLPGQRVLVGLFQFRSVDTICYSRRYLVKPKSGRKTGNAP